MRVQEGQYTEGCEEGGEGEAGRGEEARVSGHPSLLCFGTMPFFSGSALPGLVLTVLPLQTPSLSIHVLGA